MPLNKERLLAHLKASRGESPATPAKPALPKTPAIKAAEKLGQQAKKATGVNKVEKEIEQVTKADHSSALDSMKSVPDARAFAEASLSPALLRKLLSGEKLSTDEQKAVAAVCKQVGYL